MEALAAARPNMIATLNSFRDILAVISVSLIQFQVQLSSSSNRAGSRMAPPNDRPKFA
jgi:hypothetical protein